jgi:prolyl-tRNA synthetase
MRMSQLFSQTLRQDPAEAELAGHRLLLRAGYIRQLGAGIFSTLPLGLRTLRRIETILRQEIDAIGGQEVSMPIVHPAELWKQSERWSKIGAELGRFIDRTGRDMVLAMTHEEVVADLARREIHSYRQLPQLIYQIQTKWRDDPRPRAGLIRAREFDMLDSYSLDADAQGLEDQYRRHYHAYFRIFERCALPAVAVQADVGIMGGSLSHEFMYLAPGGEDTILTCSSCGYKANRQVARFRKPQAERQAPLPIELVATPGTETIESLATLLGISPAATAKAVFMTGTFYREGQSTEELVFAVVRGDMTLNETKLANAVRASALRPASPEEISRAGAEAGYASPIGLEGVLTVVDDAIAASPNLVAGANRPGFHLRNVNYGRDYSARVVADIAAANEGDGCPECGSPMHAARGVEIGNIFKLGTDYAKKMGARFLDDSGHERPMIMGSYGIGVGRLMACIAEAHHDPSGLAWPVSVAPLPVHLVVFKGVEDEGERLYEELRAAGIEALIDDRVESPGVKFKDADLIGLPLRLTVSPRSLKQGGAEIGLRSGGKPRVLPVDDAPLEARQTLDELQAALDKAVSEAHVPEM